MFELESEVRNWRRDLERKVIALGLSSWMNSMITCARASLVWNLELDSCADARRGVCDRAWNSSAHRPSSPGSSRKSALAEVASRAAGRLGDVCVIVRAGASRACVDRADSRVRPLPGVRMPTGYGWP